MVIGWEPGLGVGRWRVRVEVRGRPGVGLESRRERTYEVILAGLGVDSTGILRDTQ